MNSRLGRWAVRLGAVGVTVAVVGAIAAPEAGHAAGVLPTTTSEVSSPGTIPAGSPVTLTATVGILGLGGLVVTPQGRVTFTGPAPFGGTQVLGSATVTPNCLAFVTPCAASITTRALPAGSDVVTATYGGDSLSQSSVGTARVTVLPNPPGAPTLVSVDPLVGEDVLAWNPPATSAFPILGYNVYQGNAPNNLKLVIKDTPGNDVADTALPANNATLYYAVTAVSLGGESPLSNVLSVTTTLGTNFNLDACANAAVNCNGPTLSGTDGTGDQTTLQLSNCIPNSTCKSTAPAVLTEVLGANPPDFCANSGGLGVPGTFNTTDFQDGKSVTMTFNGSEAQQAADDFTGNGSKFFGCLGLPTEWNGYFLDDQENYVFGPVPFNSNDGLFEGMPEVCPVVHPQPFGTFVCGLDGFSSVENTVVQFQMQIVLPPGDGLLMGGLSIPLL